MNGNPHQPHCGFSAKVVQCLKEVGKPFGYVDVLSDPEVRSNLPKVSDWPTFPQLFVKGELMGGCDIITEMHSKGELKELLN
jgi:monothiol glutaredoxin